VSASTSAVRRWTTRIAVATLVAGGVALPIAASAQSHPASTTSANAQSQQSQVAQLRQEVRSGTLLKDHGVRKACPSCDAEVVTSAPGSAAPMSAAAPSGYGPSDLASAYGLPSSSSSTGTIAIIDAGVDPNLAADLAKYRSTEGLSACGTDDGCLTLKNFDGGAQPAPQTSGDGAKAEEEIAVETSLDMDMASAACPSCHLLEISVPWQDGENDNDTSSSDFSKAVSTAAAANVSAVSISYGYTATSQNTSGDELAAFNKKGVAITVSTGDSGFNGGTHQSWPSDLPTVVAVGGTTLNGPGQETAWSGGGSGCETDFTAATGQPSAVTKDCGGHRAAADVSADADPNTGVAVYDTYAPSTNQPPNWTVVGGTSASAPYIGGLFARAGNLGDVNGPNTLYSAASSNFNDITSGNNEQNDQCANYPSLDKAVCNAGTGWDGPTGLGSPKGLGAF
jgi:subtilase family serine protease